MKLILLQLLLLLVCVVHGMQRLDPLVDTTQGLVKGLQAEDGDYAMFLGIPYAKVDPDNPFGTSYPHPKFNETFEAYVESAICPQVDEFTNEAVGTIDCLQLNIYVPNKASSGNRLPVLVWIYGGRYSYGYANRYLYGPKFLVRHDVIFVTLNYRVGPYGFFCLNTPEIPGNQGLKDQLLAMRWIKDNIASFGGDVNKITIMGESAGGASIEHHLYSNSLKENLYNQAIMQSGTMFIPTLIHKPDLTRPLKVAENLGLITDDLSEALKFLTNTDVKLVIAASEKLDVLYRPCIETAFEGVESILTEHPLKMDVPKLGTMPVLVGFNSREMMVSYTNQPAEYYKNLNVINENLKSEFNYQENFVRMEDMVRHFYLGDEEESVDTRLILDNFNSDFKYNHPIQMSINKLVENGAVNVYQYMFSYSGGRNFVKKRNNITELGAAHADEIGYLFDLSYDKDPISEEDQRMIDQMTTLWTNFAKYGEPTPETSELLPAKWTPVTQETIHYLDIDNELMMKNRPYHDRIAFWELFYLVNRDKLIAYSTGSA